MTFSSFFCINMKFFFGYYRIIQLKTQEKVVNLKDYVFNTLVYPTGNLIKRSSKPGSSLST